MDFSINSKEILVATVFVLFYTLWRLMSNQKQRSKGPDGPLAPEAAGALPIIGHLHLLGAQKPLARSLGAMADKHGPVFSLRLGIHRAVVVSDYESIKECFTSNDKAIASRFESSQSKFLGYNGAAFIFASYGPYLRNIRKIVMVELLSSRRIKLFKHVISSEIDTLIKDLYSLCRNSSGHPVKVPISEKLEHSVLNVITRLVAGKRYFDNAKQGEGKTPIVEIIKEFMNLSAVLVPSDLIPALKFMDFQGSIKTMKGVSKKLDVILENWIEEHKKKTLETGANDKHDFIDVLLSAIEDDNMFGHSRDDIIKGTILTIIVGGSDTISVALDWVFSNLINHKRVLEKVVEEMDKRVRRDVHIEDLDIESLVYLQAVIKETLRLYPPGALGFPREVTEDCYVKGYFIPKGTQLITNLWKLQRDPKFWENPEEFIPERFLTAKADVDVHGRDFEYLPFGSGRRVCVGINLASQFIPSVVARLMQAFIFTTPDDAPLDMTERFGSGLPKAVPLELMIAPRFSSEFYDLNKVL